MPHPGIVTFNGERYITVYRLAEELGIHWVTLNRLIKARPMKKYRLVDYPNRVWYKYDDIKEWILHLNESNLIRAGKAD